ncbi:MAG: phage holin family protein [Betaproteobacteria bacterium]|nr:phage holin family protein [Betaproteobacteria bacterium]
MPEAGRPPRATAFSPLRRLARTLLSFVVTRGRLAASELEEQALRIAEAAVWALAALLFAGIALVMLSVVAVLLFWNSQPVIAAALVCALWLGAAAACARVAMARMRERPGFLSATLDELGKDRARFEKRDA